MMEELDIDALLNSEELEQLVERTKEKSMKHNPIIESLLSSITMDLKATPIPVIFEKLPNITPVIREQIQEVQDDDDIDDIEDESNSIPGAMIEENYPNNAEIAENNQALQNSEIVEGKYSVNCKRSGKQTESNNLNEEMLFIDKNIQDEAQLENSGLTKEILTKIDTQGKEIKMPDTSQTVTNQNKSQLCKDDLEGEIDSIISTQPIKKYGQSQVKNETLEVKQKSKFIQMGKTKYKFVRPILSTKFYNEDCDIKVTQKQSYYAQAETAKKTVPSTEPV